jgi:HK97 family phage major capsid protein
MATELEVMEAVQREVKAAGDNIKKIQTDFDKNLHDVREIAEKALKNSGDGELKAAVDVLSKGAAERHAAIEATVKKLSEDAVKAAAESVELERKFNRMKLSGGGDAADEIKHARDFTELRMMRRGELKAGTTLSDDKVDLAEYKSYIENFKLYLRQNDSRPFGGDEKKAMSIGSDPDGGYFVSPAVSSRVSQIIYESSPMRALATIETISTDKLEIPVDEDEATFEWAGETQAPSETNTPKVGDQVIPVFEMRAKPKASQQLLEDAGVNVQAWLGRKVGEKFARGEASAFINGTGMRRPRGILTYPNGTVRGTIEQLVSGDANLVTFDGLIRLSTGIKSDYAPGSSFLMQRATVGAVMLLKYAGTGEYIWRQNQQEGKPSLLLGQPVYEAADLPAIAAGTLPIAFGNFKRGYTIVDRLGITVLVDPYSEKPYVQFYSRKRVGGDVTNFEAFKLLKIST